MPAQDNNTSGSQGYFSKLRQGAASMFGGGGNQGNQQQQPPQNPQQQFPGSTQQPGNRQQDPNEPNARQDQGNNGNSANGGNQQGSQKSWLEELYTKNSPDPDKAPVFSLEEEGLNKVVGSQNFTADISDEDIQKIQAGDWGHLKTMMNKVGQGAYKAALQHGSVLTDKYVGARFEHSDKSFDTRVRKNSVDQAMSALPNYSNPAVKNHLNDIANRLQRQHPDAPPHEIAQEAQRLLMEIADGVNPENTPEAKASKAKAGKVDWAEWLSKDAQNEYQ